MLPQTHFIKRPIITVNIIITTVLIKNKSKNKNIHFWVDIMLHQSCPVVASNGT
jgi:hypothetical protein